ncbi:MAG: hypothetical protein ACR2OA_09955 [Rubripirellula sp.]
MRLLNLLISTALLLLTGFSNAANGQWPTTVAAPANGATAIYGAAPVSVASPAYTTSVPAYVAGTAGSVVPAGSVAPAVTYTTPVRSYQPAATPYYGVAPVTASTQSISNGAYQAQRPAYFDNPSVYTGQPTRGSVQASYMAPAQVQSYSPSQGLQPVTTNVVTSYAGPPITAPPITAPPVLTPAPMPYAASPPAPKREGCLSRFCNKLFGTGYTTSYYRAPVTYYRPVTTMNPATGTMVTVQQPCTSYEQQVQRNPFTTVLPGNNNTPINNCQPSCPCPPGVNACNTVPGYNQSTTFGQPAPISQTPYTGIGQVGATATGDYQAMPIPAIPPAGTMNTQPTTPNLSPLTGPPPTLAPPTSTSGSAANDLAPVQRPMLNKPATPEAPKTDSPAPSGEPKSADGNDAAKWMLQRPADSTAMIPSQTSRRSQPDPVSLKKSYGVAEPIQAPADYAPPYGPNESVIQHGQQSRPAVPAVSDPFSPPPARNPFPATTPPLPSGEADLSDWTESTSSPARPIRSVSYDKPSNNIAKPSKAKRSRHTVWTSIAE